MDSYTGHPFVNEDYKVYAVIADSLCTHYALIYSPSTPEDALYMCFGFEGL